MSETSYIHISKDKLILRDHLAVDRTTLANERTLLAYIRTALAILITGVSLIKFFDSLALEITGWVLIPIAIVVMGAGIKRYIRMDKIIHRIADD